MKIKDAMLKLDYFLDASRSNFLILTNEKRGESERENNTLMTLNIKLVG